jgi:DNA-binding transcriptional LysR family regulator
LGVPRSTVSRRISALEQALGTRLLQRTTRRVELTSAGKTYLHACGPALGTILEAGRALTTDAAETAGRLRVTAAVNLGEVLLGDVVAECLARYPELNIELVLTDRQVNLVEEKFDLAFRSGTLKDTSLVAHELGRAQLGCFATREYLRDHGTPRAPRDLLRHDCILFTPLTPRGRWTFRSHGRTVEVPVRGRLIVNSLPLALDAAVRGLGIARVPGPLGRATNQVVEVLETFAPPPRPAYAVHASGGRVAPAARVFLEIARRHLARRGLF